MSIIHSQITINIELVESETGEVILCLNFLFSPTSQLLAAVKIILIIFRYFADSKGLKPFTERDAAAPLIFLCGPAGSSILVRPEFFLNITVMLLDLKNLSRSFPNSDSVSLPAKRHERIKGVWSWKRP